MFRNRRARGGFSNLFSAISAFSAVQAFRLPCAAAWGFLARGFLLWCLCYDQVVRLANKGFKFAGGQDVGGFEKNPFISADIRGLRDAFDFQEFVELFRSALQGDWGEVAFGEVHDSEYFAAHFEAEVFAPLKILGGAGEREAKLAEPFGVWHVRDDSAGAALHQKQVHAGKSARATRALLHLVSSLPQHHRYLHLFLAAEDGYFHGVAGAVFVHDLG